MASVGCDGSHLGWWTGSSIPGTMVASLSAGWFVVLFIYFVIFLKKQGESNWEMGSFCAGWCACPGNHRDRGAHGWLWEEAGWLLLRPSQLQLQRGPPHPSRCFMHLMAQREGDTCSGDTVIPSLAQRRIYLCSGDGCDFVNWFPMASQTSSGGLAPQKCS